MLPILTHGLSMEGFGLWEQIAVGVGLLVSGATFQLPAAITRFLPGNRNRDEIREGFYSVTIFCALSGILVSVLLWILFPFFSGLGRFESVLDEFSLILVLIPVSAVVPIVTVYFRAYRQMTMHAVVTLVQSFGEMALAAGMLKGGYGLHGLLISAIAIRIAVILLGGGLIVRKLGFKVPNFGLIKTYVMFCLPLVPNSIFNRLFDAADRYILGYFLGNSAVAVYAVAYSAGSLFSTIMAPLNFVLLPLISELWNRNSVNELAKYITQCIRFSLMITIPALAGSVVLARPLLLLLVPSSYENAVSLFPVLALGFLLFGQGVIGAHLLVTGGKGTFVMAVTGFLTVINVILNIVLIPIIGVHGAVISTLVSHCIFAAFMLGFSKKIICYQIPWRSIVHFCFVSGAMACALLFIRTMVYDSLWLNIVLGVFIYFGLLFITGGLKRKDLLYFSGLFVSTGSR